MTDMFMVICDSTARGGDFKLLSLWPTRNEAADELDRLRKVKYSFNNESFYRDNELYYKAMPVGIPFKVSSPFVKS